MTLPSHRWAGLALAVVLGLTVAALWRLGIRGSDLAGLRDLGPYLARYRNPEFGVVRGALPLLGETLAMGLWGTLLATIIALPSSLWAARPVAPHGALRGIAREYLNFVRAMPDALLALVFVSGLGIGPLAGVLALGLHSSGFLGKAIADGMERVPSGVREGLVACGASRFQVARFGLWPSVEREAVAALLYTLDRNVRTAATLGLVGAGGIGVELQQALRLFEYGRASALVLLIIGLVVAIEAVATWLRARVG